MSGPYDIIYADPPWTYQNASCRGNAEDQYGLLDLDGIKAFPVTPADDCILFMWATAPLLPEGLEVISSWGFRYKTCAVWDKARLGVGYWFRGQHEILMVGTRGNVSPPPSDKRISSVIKHARGRHSEKPHDIRRWIVEAWPDARRVELFARTCAPGWDVVGNETEKQGFLL